MQVSKKRCYGEQAILLREEPLNRTTHCNAEFAFFTPAAVSPSTRSSSPRTSTTMIICRERKWEKIQSEEREASKDMQS